MDFSYHFFDLGVFHRDVFQPRHNLLWLEVLEPQIHDSPRSVCVDQVADTVGFPVSIATSPSVGQWGLRWDWEFLNTWKERLLKEQNQELRLSKGWFIWMFPRTGFFPPKSCHFNRVFHYKPSILGVPLFLETPIWQRLFSIAVHRIQKLTITWKMRIMRMQGWVEAPCWHTVFHIIDRFIHHQRICRRCQIRERSWQIPIGKW